MLSRPPAALALAFAVLSIGASCAQAATPPTDAAITTYAMPAATNAGLGLTTDPTGKVWFSPGDLFTQTPRIGVFDPSQAASGAAAFTLFPTPDRGPGAPCCSTQVRDVTYDPDKGRIWWVRSEGQYGFAAVSALGAGTTTGMQTGVANGNVDLWNAAYDATAKKVWIAERSTTNQAMPSVGPSYYPGARIASATDASPLSEYPNIALQNGATSIDSPRYDAQPQGLAPDGAGNVWFAESAAGLPGYRISRTKGGAGVDSAYDEYPIQPGSGVSSGTGPTDVTTGSDGSVWFTNQNNNSLGHMTGGTFVQYALPTIDPSLAGGKPQALATAADGTIWLAEYGGNSSGQQANAIIRIVPPTATNPNPTATVYKTGAAGPLAITVSATGDVWFGLNTPSAPGLLGRIGNAVTPAPAPSGPAPAPAPGVVTVRPATVGIAQIGKAKADGDAATIRQICVGPPEDVCSLVYLLDAHEYVKGFPGTKNALSATGARATAKPKTKPKGKKAPVVLGSLAVSLHGGESKTFSVKLGKKAAKALASKGSLKVTLVVQQVLADGTKKELSSKNLTLKKAKKKPKK